MRTEYQRSHWKTAVRWLAVGGIVLLYVGLLQRTFHVHVQMGKPLSPTDGLLLLLVLCISIPLVPQLILEVQSVKIDEDGLCLRNLIWGFKEKWEDLTELKNPQYLKFAILRGKKFWYLLNRRDLPDFERLVERITEKSINLIK